MAETILDGKIGERKVLMTNQAVARGAYEAGVKVVAGYPGTPSSEVLESLAEVAKEIGAHVEWSTNEKVALEVASCAAIGGVRSLSTMKMVGLNVASDSLFTIDLSGVNGGLVIVCADDPGAWVSQNEQDTRIYAKFARVPILEPTTPQEAKDLTKVAFDLSEELQLPVIVRTCTRLAHSSGDVVLGKSGTHEKIPYKKDLSRYYMGDVPTVERLLWLDGQQKKASELLEKKYKVNSLSIKPGQKRGIVSCNMAYNYAMEAATKLGLDDGSVAVLKAGASYPFPDEPLRKLLSQVDEVMVVEETSPFFEEHIKQVLFDIGRTDVAIYGRLSGHIAAAGELNSEKVTAAMGKAFGKSVPKLSARDEETFRKISEITPAREAFCWCAGCPHLGTFYALKRVMKKKGIKKFFNAGDIGCYLVAMFPPMDVMDTSFDMGASLAQASGMYHSGFDGPVLGSIGDSTFFHAGIPPMINAVVNKAKITMIVCDNNITAMTGHQPNPGTGFTATGEPTVKVEIANVARGCGVKFVEETDPYDFKKTCEVLEKAIDFPEASLVVSRRACAEIDIRAARREGRTLPVYVVDEKKCTGCRICVNDFGCMAIGFDNATKKAWVDPMLCMGCGLCQQICPVHAYNKKAEDKK